MTKPLPTVHLVPMVEDTPPTRRRALRLGCGALAAGLGGCATLGGSADAERPPVEDVQVILNWKPNPTQAGYFVAKDRGYYEEEGLNVELVPGQGGSFATKQVALGNYDFGLGSSAGVLQARASDLDVRSYAAAQQSSNAALYTVADVFGGELSEPAQLAGKRVAVISGSAKTRVFLDSMLTEAGVRDEVEFVSVGVEQQTANLLAGNVDAAMGIFGDGLALEMEGYDSSMLLIGDHVPTVGRTIFARPSFADDHPGTVRALLRGTARGWARAANDPSGAEDVMIDAQPSLEQSRELGVRKIEFTARNLVETDAVERHGWGWQSSSDWSAVHDSLSGQDVLSSDLDVDAAWSNEHLDSDAAAVGDWAERVTVTTPATAGTTTTT